MKKLSLIFGGMVVMTVLSFAIFLAIAPLLNKEQTVATQGIRLVNSTTLSTTENGIPHNIKVGDMFSDPSGMIYRINEIRRAQSGTVYVVISNKSLKNFNSYSEYLSRPYRNQMILDVKFFIQGKTPILEKNIELFYKENLDKLESLMETSELDRSSTSYHQSHSVSNVSLD